MRTPAVGDTSAPRGKIVLTTPQRMDVWMATIIYVLKLSLSVD
jgi:hypothetical protein